MAYLINEKYNGSKHYTEYKSPEGSIVNIGVYNRSAFHELDGVDYITFDGTTTSIVGLDCDSVPDDIEVTTITVTGASDFQGDVTVGGNFTLTDTQWDDLRVPLSTTVKNPLKDEPVFEEVDSTGLYLFAFGPANDDDESVQFVAQLPHSYKVGSDLEFHVHWLPETTNTGNVVWELDYILLPIDGTKGSVQTITATVAADGTAYKHQVDDVDTIDGSTLGISSMLVCRFTRLGDDEADTFTGKAYVMEVDFHFEKDSLGSDEEYVK